MTSPENSANRAIVLYQGAPLERIDTRALVFQETHQKESRFFIPEDIVIGRYGVIGFVLVDNKPEQRWVSYTNSEWTGVHTGEPEVYLSHSQNTSHFVNTDRGFKMMRYFILPPEVAEFFERDKFLGEPLIDKCCREGTLPEEFDENRADSRYAFGYGGYTEGGIELIEAAIRASFPELTEEERARYYWGRNQYAYVSFHPWQEFKYVTQEGQSSIYAAVNNFDDVLTRFDTNKLLSPRDLRITIEDNPQIQSPA